MSEIQTYTPSNGAMLVCSSGGDYVKTKDHLATITRLEAEKAQKQLVIDDCKRNLKEQDAAITALTRELEEARRWVNDLQSGMYINCVYCGHRYGPKDKVPCTMADALKQHIEQCPKHPMSSLRTRVEELERDRLALSDENARLNEALGEAEAKVEKVSILARNCICRELVVGGQNRLCAIMLKENHDEMKRHLTGEGK